MPSGVRPVQPVRRPAIDRARERGVHVRSAIDQLDVERALIPGEVLADFQRPCLRSGAGQGRHGGLHRGERPRLELTGRRGIAQLVGALAVEPEASALDVQPRAYPVAVLRRRRDRHGRRERNASEPNERIRDDLRLHPQLARVGDVRVEAAATARVARIATAIG